MTAGLGILIRKLQEANKRQKARHAANSIFHNVLIGFLDTVSSSPRLAAPSIHINRVCAHTSCINYNIRQTRAPHELSIFNKKFVNNVNMYKSSWLVGFVQTLL